MLKSTKRFVLSTSDLNAHGFRMLTAGADLSQFHKNPVLLFNHQRPEGSSKDQLLPLGYWDDIEIKGDQISAVPVFDEEDDFAKEVYRKVENGTLRMCSVGAQPIETSSEDMVPGQTNETVTKWIMKEASIVDSGSNNASLALYDSSRMVELSVASINDMIPPVKLNTPDNMNEKEKELSEEEKDKKLAEETKKEMSDKDKKIQELTDEVKDLKKKLADGKAESDKNKAETLVALADAEGRITPDTKDKWIEMATKNYDGTKALLETMPKHVTLKDRLADRTTTVDSKRLAQLSDMSGEELFHNGGLTELKALDVATYKLKYKDAFGIEPTDV